MIVAPRYLVDTNILLRMAYPALVQHSLCQDTVARLVYSDTSLFFCLQNAAEFWNVSTRPERNIGLGLPQHVVRQERL